MVVVVVVVVVVVLVLLGVRGFLLKGSCWLCRISRAPGFHESPTKQFSVTVSVIAVVVIVVVVVVIVVVDVVVVDSVVEPIKMTTNKRISTTNPNRVDVKSPL